MFCSKCGQEINDDAKFCQNCGFQNGKNIPIEENSIIDNNAEHGKDAAYKTPVGLIAVSWILFALCIIDDFLDFGAAIIISIAAIICSVLLVVNKNKTAKVNGIVILSIWALAFVIMVLSNNIY
jgi:uncharacterized membrane protein YvbJ